MDQEQDWAKGVAAAIGKRIAFYRERSKLSAQQTATRCAELGMPSISRVVITKLENGRREAVSTAEVLVLARVLGVHPVDLLIPLGYDSDVEILPGETVSAWSAFKWFTGSAPDPRDATDAKWLGLDNPVQLWEEHQRRAFRLPPLYMAGDSDAVAAAAGELRRVRAQMHERGMEPPPLPRDTSVIYEAAGGDGEPRRPDTEGIGKGQADGSR